ncbi:hypothetical protein [Roseovarius nitratireducens]|uniref:hypothetical protein n=1 Tax=Roseovarius nitratireducens TaxID=2044597 RepID=UPI000CE2107C|nr:hypothetical protein [Roseovarius nitratireducens]
MPVTLDIEPLETRADTPAMRQMLEIIGSNQMGLLEMRLPRLSRKMDQTHQEVSKLVQTAENCGWITVYANAVGSVHDLKLTPAGWDLIGGKPIWMKRASWVAIEGGNDHH